MSPKLSDFKSFHGPCMVSLRGCYLRQRHGKASINHSCDPNCQTEQFGNTIWIVSSKDIQAGEELTYNYGYEVDDTPADPCHCGAHNCCGYILGLQ